MPEDEEPDYDNKDVPINFKAKLIQYCIDYKIGPFSKFSADGKDGAKDNIAIYISLIQVFLVTYFLFVTISLSNGPIPSWFTYVFWSIIAIVALAFFVHWGLLRLAKGGPRDVKDMFLITHECRSENHEPVLLNDEQTVLHLSKGSEHRVKEVKFSISSFTFERDASEIPFIFAVSTLILTSIGFFLNSPILTIGRTVSFFIFVSLIISFRLIPRRSRDVDLIETWLIGSKDSLIYTSFRFYTISSWAIKKHLNESSVSNPFYLQRYNSRKGRIYLIKDLRRSFLRGISKIDFLEDDNPIGVSDLDKVQTSISFRKWRQELDIFTTSKYGKCNEPMGDEQEPTSQD